MEKINFIDLNYQQKLEILKWRNSEKVKSQMYNNTDISEIEHISFIDNLKNIENMKFFLIKDIGVINFKRIKDNFAEIGLYSNPSKYGVGNTLMKNILSFPYSKLYLEVFSDNKKAITLYKKFNFQETYRKVINNKKVICMELKNENR